MLWAQKRSVANCAYNRPHMLQVSYRDETYLKLNSVMTLRHSRKRDKIYFKKLFFLRNFLNLLQVYRTYLSWKYRKRVRTAVDWHQRCAIEWRQAILKWSPMFHQPEFDSIVICRFRQCQLTLTYLINSPRVLSFDISPIDKMFHIPFGRETLRENLMIVCEGGYEDDSFYCKMNRFLCTQFNSLSFFVPGQMLMNWFAQSLQSINGSVTSSLNENDLSSLTLKCCQNLLIAGVIRQLDASSPSIDVFRVSEVSKL